MATITPFPSATEIAQPYDRVIANAENINGPWFSEYNQKHVKYGDFLNAILGTNNSNFVRVRDDNTVVQANTSRIHLGLANTSIRNGTEVGGDEVFEISTNGWDTPVYSRAINEFSTAAGVRAQIQNSMDALSDIDSEVEAILFQWNTILGPSIVKPRVDAWNVTSEISALQAALVGAFDNEPSPTRFLGSNLSSSLSRRNVTNDIVVNHSGSTPDVVFSQGINRNLVTYNLALNDNQIASPIEVDFYFEQGGDTTFNAIQFSPRTISDLGDGVCPRVTLRFRPRSNGTVSLYRGGFSVRLFNVNFKRLADGPDYFQLGSITGNRLNITWNPTGRGAE